MNCALSTLWATRLHMLGVEEKRGNGCGYGEEERNNSKKGPEILAIDW